MKFLNRTREKQVLARSISGEGGNLVVIWGRRRCGKSTLIRNVLKSNDIYFMAQQTDESIQREQLASAIGEKIYGFDMMVYPTWESLLINLNNRLSHPITLCLDEFPYLVKCSPELPSILQKMTDLQQYRFINLILCGSSQQMMQSYILNSSSPLYGRTKATLKIKPLEAGWFCQALNCSAQQGITEYSVFGGVPRYWELRSNETSFEEAIKNLILDQYGVLHEEPSRLFLDDMRESTQAYSILSVVGLGCNRISEIASRLNKPATQLSRPIENLINLGYLKREIPFGEHEKNSKKGVYKIAEPFMNFYFTFVVPHMSRLELHLIDPVFELIQSRLSQYVSREWENLCRKCVSMAPIDGIQYDMAYRWWGNNGLNTPMEIDVVAESIDKKHLLIGECKWSDISDAEALMENLNQRASLLPFIKGRKLTTILFVKSVSKKSHILMMDSGEVMNRLRG